MTLLTNHYVKIKRFYQLYLKQIIFTELHIDPSCSLMCGFRKSLFCSSPEMWLTVYGRMCWTGDPLYVVKIIIGPIICFVLLLFVAVAGFVMFRKKYAINTFCSILLLIFKLFYILSVFIKYFSLFPSSQTQGPSGPIYASSNPEYLSANDSK